MMIGLSFSALVNSRLMWLRYSLSLMWTASGEDEEFFIVQVKRPNKDAKITTVRVEVDFIPTFKGIEVRQEAPE